MTIRFCILLCILGTNGFFAAAEVALVSVRQSRLRELAEQGQAGAQSALSLLANPSRLLSVTQVGVTLASLGLGWAGEDTVFQVLSSAMAHFHSQVRPLYIHAIALTFAFLIISYCHVIIGEVVPKNVAIGRPDRVAVLAAPALLFFYRVSQPFVVIIERSAGAILRMLGISGLHERGGHTLEELKYIVETSRAEGKLEPFEENAIQHLIELSEYSARQIMVGRNNFVSLSLDATLDEVLSAFEEHKFTRIPVYEGSAEQFIGIVHFKDFLRVLDERRFAYDRRRSVKPFRLRRYVHKPLLIPETKPLNQIVTEFRAAHTHMALVVDEFGTVTGLITLTDVLGHIFGGEVTDEHDTIRPTPSYQDKVLQLDGSTTIRDLEVRFHIFLPADAGFETLAGFLLFQFGYIPRVKDCVEYGGRRYTITQMDRNRIARVLVEKLDPKEQPDPANEG